MEKVMKYIVIEWSVIYVLACIWSGPTVVGVNVRLIETNVAPGPKLRSATCSVVSCVLVC